MLLASSTSDKKEVSNRIENKSSGEKEKQLCDLKFNEKENKERIKTLAKSIEYLHNALNSSYEALNDIETTV